MWFTPEVSRKNEARHIHIEGFSKGQEKFFSVIAIETEVLQQPGRQKDAIRRYTRLLGDEKYNLLAKIRPLK